jgi:hypothetical protein
MDSGWSFLAENVVKEIVELGLESMLGESCADIAHTRFDLFSHVTKSTV